MNAKTKNGVHHPLIRGGNDIYAIVVTICLATTIVFPQSAIAAVGVAAASYVCLLFKAKLRILANILFVTIAITVFSLCSYILQMNDLAAITDGHAGRADTEEAATVQYVSLSIEALALGGCIARRPVKHLRSAGRGGRVYVPCPPVYIVASLCPLLLNLGLYYLKFRGLDYVEIHKAGLGNDKYIMFSVLVSHAAFMRLFAAWPTLSKKTRNATIFAVCLFLYIYVYLMPLRTNLFIFGMYALYYFGDRIDWKKKTAIGAGVILLFSWMAIRRADDRDKLRDKNVIAAAVYAMSGGALMVQMVPWAYEQVQQNGQEWGGTALSELQHSESAPSARYVHEKAPAFAESGGGLGFFYLAELMLNFGYWGGMVCALGLGIVLQKIVTSQRALMVFTVAPALLANSFPLIRNDLMSTLKAPCYMILACILLDQVARWGRQSRRVAPLRREESAPTDVRGGQLEAC